ncbi:ABC transporter ATP-binding protein [bacterium]|nr:ABC transporter ATP-binding protein [bacterium]
MLKITNLETTYNDIVLALKGISIEIPPGQIVTLLGANGAGKTTSINTISGIRNTINLKVEDGSIEFEGEDLTHKEPHQIVSRGIIQVPEGRRIFAEMTVDENLKIGSYSLVNRNEFNRLREMVFAYFPILPQRINQLAGYMSGGEQQMLAIARALVARPRLIMLDEPSLGLAPLIVQEIFNIIQRINQEENLTFLLVEQNANMALSISHYGYIMENGRIVMAGPSHELLQDKDIREFYLGLSETGQRKNYRNIKHYKRRKRWLS